MKPLPAYHPPTDPWLDVIYADDDIIVLNKQAGLLSVPGNIARDSLETRVQAEFADALIVHRLDMATSGVIVMARGKANLAQIQQQFEKRQTTKHYIAVVAGVLAEDHGTVDAPIRCDWPNRPLQMICHDHGRQAITHWMVLSRGAEQTRVALTPVTGRSHQLRLHMKIIGHPILGDEWYADEPARSAAGRLLLHAQSLTFRHPATSADVRFAVPSPF